MVARAEAGSGPIGTVAGVTTLLVLLLLAVQVAFDLYATSAVSAAAYDAARIVAGSDAAGAPGAVEEAERTARQSLGRYGRTAAFDWDLGRETVSLRVRAANPGLLPAGLRRPLGLDRVDRTVRVRTERLR